MGLAITSHKAEVTARGTARSVLASLEPLQRSQGGSLGHSPDRAGNQRTAKAEWRQLRPVSRMPAAKAHSHEAAFVEGHTFDVTGDGAQTQDGGREGIFRHHQPQAQA